MAETPTPIPTPTKTHEEWIIFEEAVGRLVERFETHDHPVNFHDPGEIRAIEQRRKSQFRRLMVPQPPAWLAEQLDCGQREIRHIAGGFWGAFAVAGGAAACRAEDTIHCPFGEVGDRLFVREPWVDGEIPDFAVEENEMPEQVWYRARQDAAGSWISNQGYAIDSWIHEDENGNRVIPWLPPRMMPAKFARFWLTITEIRAERLRDISVADCLREGIDHDADEAEAAMIEVTGDGDDRHAERFANLWDAKNAKNWHQYRWDANPWVWVVTFQMPPFEPEPTRQIAWDSARHEK